MQAHTHTLTDCNVRAPIAPLGLVGRYRTNKIVARRVIYWLAEAITVSNTRQSNPLKKYQRSIHPECSPRPLLTNTLGRSNTHTLSLSLDLLTSPASFELSFSRAAQRHSASAIAFTRQPLASSLFRCVVGSGAAISGSTPSVLRPGRPPIFQDFPSFWLGPGRGWGAGYLVAFDATHSAYSSQAEVYNRRGARTSLRACIWPYGRKMMIMMMMIPCLVLVKSAQW